MRQLIHLRLSPWMEQAVLLREENCIYLSGPAGRLLLLVVKQSFSAHLGWAY